MVNLLRWMSVVWRSNECEYFGKLTLPVVVAAVLVEEAMAVAEASVSAAVAAVVVAVVPWRPAVRW